jgi:hypothetical protein
MLSTWCLIVVSGSAILSSCEMQTVGRMCKSEQLGKWNGLKMERRSVMGNTSRCGKFSGAARNHL